MKSSEELGVYCLQEDKPEKYYDYSVIIIIGIG